MNDILSSDDTLCLVHYEIFYTKYGHEWSDGGKDALINWATTESDLKTYLLTKYFRDHNMNPSLEDLKYYGVRLEVKGTFPRRGSDYEERRTVALEKIQEDVGRIADRQGTPTTTTSTGTTPRPSTT